MTGLEFLELYKGMLVFGAGILIFVVWYARLAIRQAREDRVKRERGK